MCSCLFLDTVLSSHKAHYELKMEENENVENISINNIADISEKEGYVDYVL